MARELPQEVMVWHSYPLSHIGTWATTRYPEDAVAYAPRARLEAVEKERDEQIEWVQRLADDLIAAEAEVGRILSELARAEVALAEAYRMGLEAGAKAAGECPGWKDSEASPDRIAKAIRALPIPTPAEILAQIQERKT